MYNIDKTALMYLARIASMKKFWLRLSMSSGSCQALPCSKLIVTKKLEDKVGRILGELAMGLSTRDKAIP